MIFLRNSLCLLFLWGVLPEGGQAQSVELKLEQQMIVLQRDVIRVYNELQKFLGDDLRHEELLAFESLMNIYVDEVLKLHDAFWRINGSRLESQPNIAARCLIFRALTYLERASGRPENYQKACEDYKTALRLARNELNEPLLGTRLPHEVWIGNRLYTRLADLLDNREKNFQMIDCFKMPQRVSSAEKAE